MTDLIHRAGNPVVEFGRQLGRDELYALGTGAVLTAIAYFIIDLAADGEPPAGLLAAILPFVSPLCEKPGLVAHYVKEGVEDWQGGKGGPWRCIWLRLTDGRALKTIRADLLFHDPAYMALMALGIWSFSPESASAAGFLSALSFSAALVMAAMAEVAVTDWQFRRLGRRLGKAGFESESYYETRYLVSADGMNDPDRVLEVIAARFGLPDRYDVAYEDCYFTETSLAPLNGHEPSVRLRRTSGIAGSTLDEPAAVQVILQRPEEIDANGLSLFRCFSVRKAKHSRPVDAAMPACATVRYGGPLYGFASGTAANPVCFRRKVARDPDGLYVSVDVVDTVPGGSYWIEVKVRRNLNLLKEANEFIAMNFSVRGTTRSKPRVQSLLASGMQV